ncbi:MAG: hypothetical protein JXA87_13135, partial [Thermoleophilia bacterium]|nr:hypothetical protein [Thermoleophilia bacterium]
MNPSACELVRKAAPELRILVRKAAELETEAWLDANLPEGVGLPPAAVMAAQVVGLREAVFGVLQRQRRRYVKYLSEHPPALLPVDASALRDLPWQAALTYHSWLEGVALRQEWAYDPDRGTELDRRELEDVLRRHLREAVGCGGVAGLRSAGGLPPGLAPLGHRAAGALRRRLAAWAGSRDAGARALHRAVSDRAANAAVRGVVLRDGAGRPVAAATYTVIARGELTVRYLGALEAAAAGSGLQMVRELAGLAALEGRGLVLWSAVESEAVFTGLGFSPEPGGRFALSAASARKLAQTPPG